MPDSRLRSGPLVVSVTDDGMASVAVEGWTGLHMGALGSALSDASGSLARSDARVSRGADGAIVIAEDYAPGPVTLRRTFTQWPGGIAMDARIANRSTSPVRLAEVRLLDAAGPVSLGPSAEAVRLLEQAAYWCRVRRLGQAKGASGSSGDADASQAPVAGESQYVWLAFDAASRMALLVGFETGERWTGHIRTSGPPGGMPLRWSVRLDGGLTDLPPGSDTRLESLCIMAGPDPWDLLCTYGDRVRTRHGVRPPSRPPISWCSWYPYRLGVSDERTLATARIAAERLRPLGLSIIELDLGWERRWLPSAFDESDQFPRGLKALAEDLEAMGFALGVWKAPFSISEHDAIAKEHPDWLLRGEGDAGPRPMGSWYWEPHGQTYALDLTHPDALAWLRERARSLAERGVRYFKADFIGWVMNGALTARHDRSVVAGGGAEAARAGMGAILTELRRVRPDAQALNCGGPEIPGAGAFPLLYTCNDTGNTGFVGWRHLEEDYGRHVAGHLWKNGRWGVIQPSCLVVGLPGGIEEARLRATATFLAGGQVDIGDDLTTLPEDRWRILLATLPPIGKSATPVDLFEPIAFSSLAYDAMASGRGGDVEAVADDGVSRVWVLPVVADWDRWTLIGLFNYDTNDDVEYGKALITRFLLPLARLGLDCERPAAFEFWSGQYVGVSPFVSTNPKGYRHPGDMQRLIHSPNAETWEVAFFGPGVKLLAVRAAREHPWPVGTSFHQSCGMELAEVRWNDGLLSGKLIRPKGESGVIVVASDRGMPKECRVSGRRAPASQGANGSVILPLVADSGATRWEMRW